MSLHSTAAQSVHHTVSKAPPRLNTYLWLPTLLAQARPTNVLYAKPHASILGTVLAKCLLNRIISRKD